MTDIKHREEVDAAKREFIKRFGKYAATAPMGMYLLMSPVSSHAQASGSSCPSCDISSTDVSWDTTVGYHHWNVTPTQVNNNDWALYAENQSSGTYKTFYYNDATQQYFKFNTKIDDFTSLPQSGYEIYDSYSAMVAGEGPCDETLYRLLDCISDFFL